MEFIHEPVMLGEALAALAAREGGRYVDGTLGGGGHTRAIVEAVGPTGLVLALDRDPDALENAAATFAGQLPNLILRRANFSQVDQVLAELGWGKVDGVLLDLGLSSHQLRGSGRGFSFGEDEPLDMRMDPDIGRSAAELVNRLPERELADLIFQLGEERASRKVARAIVQARSREPIETSARLAQVVRRAMWRPGPPPRIDTATRTFQALRLAVNGELDHLATFLAVIPGCLRIGGRLAVISFHSLEDRAVKQALVKPGRGATAGPGPFLLALDKKPLRPSEAETVANPRARSARLRVAELSVGPELSDGHGGAHV